MGFELSACGPYASWSQTMGCSPDSAFCVNERTWLSTATSKVCPLSVVWPSYLFCVPSTLVNVTAWLAMNSSSVAGAVVSADVRQPLALTFLSSPVISGAPWAAATISSSPAE